VRRIPELIANLSNTPRTLPTALEPVKSDAAPITATTGEGMAEGGAFSGNTPLTVEVEIATVSSTILVTADGAFEKPLGWPTSGAYGSEATYPGTLPDSLTLVSGILTLDKDVQHYEQKRVHLSYRTVGNSVVCTKYYVPLEHPFKGIYFVGERPGGESAYTMGYTLEVVPYLEGSDLLKSIGLVSG
jgi:hypothetical protein